MLRQRFDLFVKDLPEALKRGQISLLELSFFAGAEAALRNCAENAGPSESVSSQLEEVMSYHRGCIRRIKDHPDLPQVGKEYYCFDDGKINMSRRYTVVITDIVKFGEEDQDIIDLWRKEVLDCPWLYGDTTDVFVHTKKGKRQEVFVRDNNMKWFGIGGLLNCGRLDIDGELNEQCEQAGV